MVHKTHLGNRRRKIRNNKNNVVNIYPNTKKTCDYKRSHSKPRKKKHNRMNIKLEKYQYDNYLTENTGYLNENTEYLIEKYIKSPKDYFLSDYIFKTVPTSSKKAIFNKSSYDGNRRKSSESSSSSNITVTTLNIRRYSGSSTNTVVNGEDDFDDVLPSPPNSILSLPSPPRSTTTSFDETLITNENIELPLIKHLQNISANDKVYSINDTSLFESPTDLFNYEDHKRIYLPTPPDSPCTSLPSVPSSLRGSFSENIAVAANTQKNDTKHKLYSDLMLSTKTRSNGFKFTENDLKISFSATSCSKPIHNAMNTKNIINNQPNRTFNYTMDKASERSQCTQRNNVHDSTPKIDTKRKLYRDVTQSPKAHSNTIFTEKDLKIPFNTPDIPKPIHNANDTERIINNQPNRSLYHTMDETTNVPSEHTPYTQRNSLHDSEKFNENSCINRFLDLCCCFKLCFSFRDASQVL